MTVALWIAAILVAADTLIYVGRVGRPRPPITPGLAVLSVMQYGTVSGLLVWSAVNR